MTDFHPLGAPGPKPCACGCGELIPVAKSPSRQNRFIHNHHARLQIQNLDRYVVEDCGYETPCWIWQGLINAAGYGQVGRNQRAHRALYEKHVGPIPEGLELDHLCRVPACCNPAHLEPVTRAENRRRMSRLHLGTECARGHSLDDATVRPDGTARCKVCHRENMRRYRARKKQMEAA